MADNVTLSALRDEVRFLGDFENSRVVTDTRLNARINNAIKGLWDLLLLHRADAYVKEQNPAPTSTPGSNILALPADFYRLRCVEVLVGSDYFPVRTHNLRDAWRIERRGAGQPRGLRYRIQGATLRLAPTPTQVYTFRVHYLPVFADLVADGDTFDGINGYDDLVVWSVIADLKRREGTNPAEAEGKVAALTKPIITAMTDIDAEPFSLAGGRDLVDDFEDDADEWWV